MSKLFRRRALVPAQRRKNLFLRAKGVAGREGEIDTKVKRVPPVPEDTVLCRTTGSTTGRPWFAAVLLSRGQVKCRQIARHSPA